MLTNFTQMIVAYTPSKACDVALQMAADIRKKYHAKFTVLNVNPHKSKEGTVKEKVDAMMKEANTNFGYVEKEGKPFREILALEKAIEADLIVMGSHGSKERDSEWIGGNAFKVLSGSKCPVLVLPESFTKNRFEHIVMPLSDSSETRQKVPLTVSLAKKYNSTLHIINVHRNRDPEAVHKLNIYAEQAKKYCDKHAVKYDFKEIYDNNIATSSINYAEEINADLIVIMSERESPTGYFMGHYAQQLVNTSNIPVLTIHVKEMGITGIPSV